MQAAGGDEEAREGGAEAVVVGGEGGEVLRIGGVEPAAAAEEPVARGAAAGRSSGQRGVGTVSLFTFNFVETKVQSAICSVERGVEKNQ
jgi:hypothetical protein